MSTTLNDTPTQGEMTSAATPSICGSDGKIVNRNNTGDNRLDSSSIAQCLQAEIKHEPPEDINDTPHDNSTNSINDGKTDCPKIRLTPTIKLMPVQNPVDPKRRYACPYDNCTKSYGKSSHLRSHLTWHTGIKPFVCSDLNCGKGFTRSDELNRHLRTHTGEKPFECIQCTKKFSRSDHLTKHLATHAKQMLNSVNGSKKSRPQGDGKQVKKECDLNGTTRLNYSFEDTDFSAESDQYVDVMHFMASEPAKSFKTEGEAATETRTGDVSLNSIPIKIKLERPENSDEYHVVSPNPPAKIDPFVPIPMRNAVVSELDYQMSSKFATSVNNEAKSEEKSVLHFPITTESVPEVIADGALMGWPELGKGFPECDYDPHRPWRCKLCTKSFKRQDDLSRHLRTHTGEKPFVCVACERRFMRSDHLKKHLKTHNDLR